MIISALLASLTLLVWVYLAVMHGRFWRILIAEPSIEPESWPSVDIIVPARNEADILPRSLASLLAQDYAGSWRVVLVDDHSTDGTSEAAKHIAAQKNKSDKIDIVAAPDLPKSWSGKVAAMQAGVKQSDADYILFTDADIEHPAHSLNTIVARAVEKKLDLTSLMVKLRCRDLSEQLLIPAFVFFFAMLYPFERANDDDSDVAAAAGGVMLVRRKALDHIGGLASIKSAIIDDCSLAKNIKRFGGEEQTAGKIELTLSPDVCSLRAYTDVGSVWKMIARSAFTQLRYSPWLLAGTVFGMGLLFLAPLILPLVSGSFATAAGLAASILMILIYIPMVRFYNLSPVWALTLPAAAMVYIGATIDSARLYWLGKGGQWKGRTQAS
jgi:hopene-associated glycosyltransferase HpnB